jgi:hypothetical protein
MYLGMQLTWEYGFHQLHVESYSKTLVDMITRIKINGNPSTLVRRIQELLKLNWQVFFNHTWREGNRSADWLANFSFSLDSFNTYVMETPYREISSLNFNDIYKTCISKNIRV